MDIGAEISKKIQMAITAKLKELDAYVDDELPDYIMIMVANKKTESQMTEALSLFLSNNTKIFTSWLHNLLATLRKVKPDKKSDDGDEADEHDLIEESSSPAVLEKSPEQKNLKTEENSPKHEADMEKRTLASEQKDKEPAEPEITINAESDNIFEIEEELHTITETVVENNISDDSILKSPPLVQQSTDIKKSSAKQENISLPATDKRKNSESEETTTRHRRDSEKSSHKSTVSRKRKSEEFQQKSTHRRSPVSRKRREDRSSERRERRSDRTLESDSRRYSTVGHSTINRRSSEKSRVRDWDRGKGEDSEGEITSAWDNGKSRNREQWVESDDEDEKTTAKLRGTISSAVNAVFQDAEFVSDSESDDEHSKTSTVITSKVAYPQRKMRVPLSKQANKALLMKAVTDAERSVRKKNALLSAEVDETEILKKSKRTQKYKHARNPNDIWVEKPMRVQRRSTGNESKPKNLILKRVLDKPMYQDREEKEQKSRSKKVILVRKNVESRRRQTLKDNEVTEITRQKKSVRTKPAKVILLEDEEEQPVTVIHVRRKNQDKKKGGNVIYINESSSDDDTNNSVVTKHENTQIFMRDRRKFVARDTSPIHSSSEVQKSPAVKFDSRQATRNSDNSEVEFKTESKLKRTQKATAKVSPRPQQSTRLQVNPAQPKPTVSNIAILSQEKTQNPRFIVTLDGIAAPKQQKLEKVEDTKQATKSFKFQPVMAPTPDKVMPINLTKKHIPVPILKPVVIEAVDTEDDHEETISQPATSEIGMMRKKLLKVQEEAAKLKQMQAKLAAAQAQQNTMLKSGKMYSDVIEAEQRSIYIGNVHFSTSEKQLSDYFSICGKISRVTILKDAYTGHPKGFAYLEFDDKRAVSSALALDNTMLNNRVIRVTLKQSKPLNSFPTARAHIPSRSLYPTRHGRRLYRGSRFQQSTTRFNFPSTTAKLPSRNKTWVNPAISSSSK